MRIRGNQINPNAVNPWCAAAEKAAAVQRAADIRKKLMKNARDIESIAGPDEAFMVGHWLDSSQSPPQQDVEYRTATAGKDSDFG